MTNHPPLPRQLEADENDPTRFRGISSIMGDIQHARMEYHRAMRLEGCLLMQGFLPPRSTIAEIDRNTWLSNVWAWTH